MESKKALKIDVIDNVATLLDDAHSDDIVCVYDKGGQAVATVASRSSIAFGHKIALCGMDVGTAVVKYGETIGRASGKISVGDHVHIHNMDSARGRGDLDGGD
ncbi:MAG TPA: UxaA family hydrolase [Bacillota bacterium]|nr:UxaA family hydrolase [Bacillota bacterium]